MLVETREKYPTLSLGSSNEKSAARRYNAHNRGNSILFSFIESGKHLGEAFERYPIQLPFMKVRAYVTDDIKGCIFIRNCKRFKFLLTIVSKEICGRKFY